MQKAMTPPMIMPRRLPRRARDQSTSERELVGQRGRRDEEPRVRGRRRLERAAREPGALAEQRAGGEVPRA